MKSVLLCASSPLLVKSLYGMIRDAGYEIEEAETPALAVGRALAADYAFLVIEPGPFGLPVREAARILAAAAPELIILCIGTEAAPDADLPMVTLPADLDAIRRTIRLIATAPPTTTAPEGRTAWA